MAVFGDMGYLGSDERPMIITIDGLKKHWSAVPTRRRRIRARRSSVTPMISRVPARSKVCIACPRPWRPQYFVTRTDVT